MEEALPTRFFIIRPFARNDEAACKQIIGDSVMSSVNRTFMAAMLRETTFQLMIFLAAILFILVGVPLQYCAMSVPLTIISLYVIIWSTVFAKSLEVQHEISLVKQQYQQSDKTNLWVAEFYGPMIDFDAKAPISYMDNCNQLNNCEDLLSSKKKRIVGFVGVQRNQHRAGGHPCNLWLRRLVVSSDVRRKRIATELVNKVTKFCYEIGYSSIETCINECQQEGREFLLNRGFELELHYHKNVLGSSAVYTKYIFRRDLLHAKSALNA